MAQSFYGHVLIIACGYLALSGTATKHLPDSASIQRHDPNDRRCTDGLNYTLLYFYILIILYRENMTKKTVLFKEIFTAAFLPTTATAAVIINDPILVSTSQNIAVACTSDGSITVTYSIILNIIFSDSGN